VREWGPQGGTDAVHIAVAVRDHEHDHDDVAPGGAGRPSLFRAAVRSVSRICSDRQEDVRLRVGKEHPLPDLGADEERPDARARHAVAAEPAAEAARVLQAAGRHTAPRSTPRLAELLRGVLQLTHAAVLVLLDAATLGREAEERVGAGA
jgi:hypothetical protein